MPISANVPTPIIYTEGHEGLVDNPFMQSGGISGLSGSTSTPADNVNDVQNIDIGPVGEDNVLDDYSSGASLSHLMKENPNLSYEDYMKLMAEHSDEWAEKLMDYYLEKQSIDEQNAYTANREDTAYQRLVEDLKKAGLNPALMYGSTASTSASGSVGHLGLAEGANSRGVSNVKKIKELLLSMVSVQWMIEHQGTQDKLEGLNLIAKLLIPLFGAFS